MAKDALEKSDYSDPAPEQPCVNGGLLALVRFFQRLANH
jgi:hypothetical protein